MGTSSLGHSIRLEGMAAATVDLTSQIDKPIEFHLTCALGRIICGLWGHYKGWAFVLIMFELFCLLEALSGMY